MSIDAATILAVVSAIISCSALILALFGLLRNKRLQRINSSLQDALAEDDAEDPDAWRRDVL